MFLGDPRIYTPECESYRLESGRKFPYDDVLNWRVGDKGVLQPGANIEGLLLAYTMFTRISPDYLHGETAPAELFVIDQLEREHSSDVEILIDRTATMRPFVRRPRGQGLFDRAEETKYDRDWALVVPTELANQTGC